jgi:hypothetical protein
MFHAQDGTRVVEARSAWLPENAPAPAWEADAVFDHLDGRVGTFHLTSRSFAVQHIQLMTAGTGPCN